MAWNTRKVEELMLKAGLREEDIEESFIRSRGPGGQNVNKVSTCVQLRHVPSGMVVRSQEERSQALNRLSARAVLAQKMISRKRQLENARRRKIEKIKRQKRRRPRYLKEKILEDKRHRSEKKRLRRSLRPGEF
jgi:protein subunit release factor B